MKTDTDQIKVVEVEEPKFEQVQVAPQVAAVTAADSAEETFGGWLAPREEVAPQTEAIDIPTAPQGSNGRFGDDLDIPDFLK